MAISSFYLCSLLAFPAKPWLKPIQPSLSLSISVVWSLFLLVTLIFPTIFLPWLLPSLSHVSSLFLPLSFSYSLSFVPHPVPGDTLWAVIETRARRGTHVHLCSQPASQSCHLHGVTVSSLDLSLFTEAH